MRRFSRQRLQTIASSRTSNVDKKSLENQRAVRLCNYVDVYKNDSIVSKLDFMSATATPGQIAAFHLRAGDTVITKDSETADDIGIPAFVAEDIDGLVCGYHLAVIRPDPLLASPRFVYWALRDDESAQQWEVLATGVTRVGLRKSDIGKLLIPVPPRPEQEAIAQFLDRETAIIDDLIAKQKALIQLLAERRRAVITQVVTKGLDPCVTTKNSGVEWLGSVPAHWTVAPLKRSLVRLENGVSPQAESSLAGPGEWGVLKSGCVNGGRFDDEQHKRLPADFQFPASLKVKVGDVLVCRASGSVDLVGSCAEVSRLRYQLILSDKTFRLVPNRTMSGELLGWILNSGVYRAQVATAISGAEGLANNLPGTALKNFLIVVPPPSEQRQIVRYLHRQTRQLDRLIDASNQSVTLLQERRSALITAAVTGKIDVRGAV